MTRYKLLAASLTASIAIGGAAYAADQATTSSMLHETAIQKDVSKLSVDGAKGFQDLHQARLAIFDADPARAKTLIAQSQAALAKAKTDESVFTKAEAELKSPPVGKEMAMKNAKEMSNEITKADMKTPIAWLPVDGQLLLDEDFVATPQKAAAVSDANKNLEKGDRKGAVEKLKLGGVSVNFTMAIVPLVKTTSDVDQAAKLLDQGKYYEANSVLKQAEDGLRFDVIDVTTLPQKSSANSADAKGTEAMPSSTGTVKPAH
ncbi:YfdX family protein [Methylobacterium sp. BTF04]|uniref:YfdX family protein n=1 Tax=Methylobacterium sp. BTF04 TaxID=2708300 RepID=UPI0013D12288|nr:YfdX family protein [Methylobacterium sp. BTF04]NEU14436.1 YfdX family protein [Methylobacterium sp. BTF04]